MTDLQCCHLWENSYNLTWDFNKRVTRLDSVMNNSIESVNRWVTDNTDTACKLQEELLNEWVNLNQSFCFRKALNSLSLSKKILFCTLSRFVNMLIRLDSVMNNSVNWVSESVSHSYADDSLHYVPAKLLYVTCRKSHWMSDWIYEYL